MLFPENIAIDLFPCVILPKWDGAPDKMVPRLYAVVKIILIKGPKEENYLVVTIIITSSCTQQNFLDW